MIILLEKCKGILIDKRERELQLQEAKYLQKGRNIKEERNWQQKESLFQRAQFYASISELEKALFDDIETMDLLESSTQDSN